MKFVKKFNQKKTVEEFLEKFEYTLTIKTG